MHKKVPSKNIDPVLVDIKKPNFNYEKSIHSGKLNLFNTPKISDDAKTRKIKLIAAGFSTLFVIILATFVVINFFQIKNIVKKAGTTVVGNFTESVRALKNFEPDKATKYLSDNKKQIGELNSFLESGGKKTILNKIGSFIPVFKKAGSLIGDVTSFNLNFLELSKSLGELEENGFKYFKTDGENFIKILTDIRKSIGNILNKGQKIKNSTASLKNLSSVFNNIDRSIGGEYLTHSADLYQLQGFLDNFLKLIGTKEGKHIAIFFQNPAEIRPGGGFIGSYADLTVTRGQMANLDVRDIYDPDGWVMDKVIPPLPLQRTTRDWGARDANWFFDFPTSAKTVLGFLESSQFYKDRKTTFDASIALNINVLGTLLKIVGPIKLDEYNLTIDRNNFLKEIQREVEAGKDKKAGKPKRILKVLTPIILERLENLDDKSKRALIEETGRHLKNKDIMFYAKNDKIENFLKYVEVAGDIYEIPNNFWGSYIAVVNANIAGGKSDAYISEHIDIKIDVDTNGGSLTDLSVSRAHTGNTQKDPWWRAKNQDYIQIYTTPATGLISVKGNNYRNSSNGFNYMANNYVKNPDLAKLNGSKIFLNNYKIWTLEDGGKKVFATWFTTPAGSSKTLTMRYQTTYANPDVVEVGRKYTFVFEKQSGVSNSIKATISAPLGYKWKENNNEVYIYENNNPEGRVKFDLTLTK